MKMSVGVVFTAQAENVKEILDALENKVASVGGLMVYTKTTPKSKLYLTEVPFSNGANKNDNGGG